MQRSSNNTRGAVGGMANNSPAMTHSSICLSSAKIDTSRSTWSFDTLALPPARTKSVSAGCQQTDCVMKEKAAVQSYCAHPNGSAPSPPQGQLSSAPSAAAPPNPATEERRVRFDPDVRGQVFDTTLQDLLNSWHAPDEFRRLRDMTRAEAKILRYLLKKRAREPLSHDEAVALDATPIRGIEMFVSRRTFVERGQKQRTVIQGVLAEQQRQRYMSSTTPSPSTTDVQMSALSDDIALLSATFSYDAQRRALEQGQIDAIEAAHCHMSD